MKKIILITTVVLGLLFNACTPMQDIMDELDSSFAADNERALFLKDKQVAPSAYTLTEEDYALSTNESVSNYKNFSSYDLPKDYLPEILNQKFSGENAQMMMVTYNFYSRPSVDKDNAREIKDDEYGEMGEKYSNFSDEDVAEALIAKLLDRKVYVEDAGEEMTVKYVKFATYETRYIKVNADGTSEEVSYSSSAHEVTDAQYEATGNGKYKNFYKIGNALSDLAQLAQDEGTAPITYSCTVYLNFLDEFIVYVYNGSNWVIKQSVMPVSEELNYALNEEDITQSYWWADPAIKYTIAGDDWCLEVLNGENCKYANFDLRSGKADGERSIVVAKVGLILDHNFDVQDGQQYLVTFAYYDGSSGSATIRVVKEGGVWTEVEG